MPAILKSHTQPPAALLDEAGNPVPGVTTSTNPGEVIEKACALDIPSGETRRFKAIWQIEIVVEGVSCSDPTDPVDSVDPDPVDPPVTNDNAFQTEQSASRFLSQATFGAPPSAVSGLVGQSASLWFSEQLAKPASSYLQNIQDNLSDSYNPHMPSSKDRNRPNDAFWEIAIDGADQLRQRMTFALSQIVVASNAGVSALGSKPLAFGYYQDALSFNALGNYRDLLQDVTYSPAMGEYLTYIKNEASDPSTGSTPDENYAREIMQLFSIGLIELNMDGTPKLVDGETVETYSNADVMGLARVFTGLSLDTDEFHFRNAANHLDAQIKPMKVFPEYHSPLEKTFLGVAIPAGTSAQDSITIALDTLIAHPNTPPFLARQLIQRLVKSVPSPDYVERVAQAFADGRFTLPNGTVIGDGRRGDLAATAAAVLFDPEARSVGDEGKIREPVLRIAQWARVFGLSGAEFAQDGATWGSGARGSLGQSPFKSPSVFNFYRPGYVPPSTESGEAGYTVPEMQIVTASNLVDYATFIDHLIVRNGGVMPAYAEELALADDPVALVSHLDRAMNHGSTSEATKQAIAELIAGFSGNGAAKVLQHALVAILTSPEYIVIR